MSGGGLSKRVRQRTQLLQASRISRHQAVKVFESGEAA